MRWHLTLLALAATALAQDMQAEPPPGRLARGEMDAPAAFVRLREGGVLQVKAGEEWKDATLNDVAKFLKGFAEKQDEEMRKGGKSAYETLPGGAKASGLFVSIEVEPTVPWQHVQWVMTVAAEQKYYKLEMSDGTRKMLVFLPADRGAEGAPREPPLELRISVHAVARTEKPGSWGDLTVMRPVDVRYKMGNEESSDLAPVRDYIRKGHAAIKDTPNCTISGEIKAGNKVPFAKILDLIETFEATGLTNMRFCSINTAPPTPAVRDAARLPFPLKNYDAAN